MPRPWEYTRWRRLMMQAVLCGGLSLAIVLASWVGLSHARTLDVTLGNPAKFRNDFCDINVRLPVGWATEISTVSGSSLGEGQLSAAILEAREPKAHYGARRSIHLLIGPASDDGAPVPSPDEVVDEFFRHRVHGKTRRFDFLGHTGVIVENPMESVRSGEEDGPRARAVAFACTVVTAPKPVVAAIWMDGPPTLSDVDIHVLEKVAQSIIPNDPSGKIPDIVQLRDAAGQSRPHWIMQRMLKPTPSPSTDNTDPD